MKTNKKRLQNKANLIIKLHHLDNDAAIGEVFGIGSNQNTSCYICKFWQGECTLSHRGQEKRHYIFTTAQNNIWCIGWLDPENKKNVK